MPVPDCRPSQGLACTLFPRVVSSSDLMDCARSSRKPGGRDHAEVALADLPMTRLRPIDPTEACKGY